MSIIKCVQSVWRRAYLCIVHNWAPRSLSPFSARNLHPRLKIFDRRWEKDTWNLTTDINVIFRRHQQLKMFSGWWVMSNGGHLFSWAAGETDQDWSIPLGFNLYPTMMSIYDANISDWFKIASLGLSFIFAILFVFSFLAKDTFQKVKKVFWKKVFVQGGPQQFFEDVFPFPETPHCQNEWIFEWKKLVVVVLLFCQIKMPF